MKRLFIILLSVAALISASFLSCSSDDSSSGGGGDNYYQGGGNGNYSDGNDGADNEDYDYGNDWDDDDENYDNDDWENDDNNYYVPSAPQNVTTKATSSSSIEVSWDAVEGADSYTVYYRLSLGAGNESYERDGTETVKTTSDISVSIDDLTEWKIYIFFVTAQNSAGESFANIVFDYPCSTTDSDENNSDTTTLSAPTGLTATAASSSSIELSWNSVSDATTYYVYKSESSSYSTATLVDVTTSTSTTIGELKANTTYYFWVKAFNGTTISDYSSYDYATTKATSSDNSGTTTSNTATIYFVGSSSAISATGFNNIYVGNYQFGDLFTSVKTSKTLSAGTVDGPYQIKAGTYLLKFGNPTTGTVTNSYTYSHNSKRGDTKTYGTDYEFSFESGKTYSIIKKSSLTNRTGRDGSTTRITSYSIEAKEGTD